MVGFKLKIKSRAAFERSEAERVGRKRIPDSIKSTTARAAVRNKKRKVSLPVIKDWQPMSTAPRDGRKIKVKRIPHPQAKVSEYILRWSRAGYWVTVCEYSVREDRLIGWMPCDD